jgi:hypothetical protein
MRETTRKAIEPLQALKTNLLPMARAQWPNGNWLPANKNYLKTLH